MRTALKMVLPLIVSVAVVSGLFRLVPGADRASSPA